MSAGSVKREGLLMTSFQMMGSLNFSLQLSSHPDQGEMNEFLERLKGKAVRVTIEEVQP